MLFVCQKMNLQTECRQKTEIISIIRENFYTSMWERPADENPGEYHVFPHFHNRCDHPRLRTFKFPGRWLHFSGDIKVVYIFGFSIELFRRLISSEVFAKLRICWRLPDNFQLWPAARLPMLCILVFVLWTVLFR